MSDAAIGATPVTSARTASSTSSRLCPASSVSVAPGSTSDTRTCRPVTSCRSDSLNAPIPCLVRL